MAKNPKAGIEVGVNDRPAIEGLRSLAKSFGAFSVQAAASLQLAQAGWRALTGAIGAVVDVTSEYVELAMEQERVERRAIAATQTRQTFSREELDLLQQANAARQQQLGIGDEVQLQLQGTMATMGVAKEQLDDATRAAIGLSEAMGIGLEEAAKMSAKALSGNVAALAEVGIKVTTVAEAQAALNGLYQVAIEQSGTLQTRLSVLSANYGDLKEVVGGAVTQSGALRDIIDAVSQAVLEFTTYLNSPTGKQAVDGFFRSFAIGAAMAIDSIEDMRVAAIDVMNWFKRHFTDQFVAESLASEPSTLRKLSARLYGIGFSALEVMAPPAPGAAPTRPAGGAGGRNAGGMLPEVSVELGRIRSARLAQLENEIQTYMEIEDGMRRALAEQQVALALEQADIQRQVDMEVIDQRNELFRQAHEQRIEITRDMSREQMQAIIEGGEAIKAAQQSQMDGLASIAMSVTDVIGSAISDLITQWASGADMADMTVGRFVGAIIRQLGTMMIQTGVAAMMLAPLSLIPGLGWLVGGMPGVALAVGGGLIAAGSGMVALGASMGGGQGTGAASAPRGVSGGRPGGATATAPDVMPRGFAGARGDMAAAPSYNVSVSFGVVGDERRAARMIRDVLERGR